MRWFLGLCLLLLGHGHASAQRCEPAPEPWGDPWEATVSIPSVEVGDPTVIRLTRAQGEAIRCALVRALRSERVRRLPADVRDRLRRRRVGPLWLDDGRPRIGSFWLQRATDGSLELVDTLMMTRRVRLAVVARFERSGDRWRLQSLDSRIGHHR